MKSFVKSNWEWIVGCVLVIAGVIFMTLSGAQKEAIIDLVGYVITAIGAIIVVIKFIMKKQEPKEVEEKPADKKSK